MNTFLSSMLDEVLAKHAQNLNTPEQVRSFAQVLKVIDPLSILTETARVVAAQELTVDVGLTIRAVLSSL